jgi:hypothetical protein
VSRRLAAGLKEALVRSRAGDPGSRWA